MGRSGSNRVLRGGSWNNNATNCRSANRNRNNPTNTNNNNGFRVVLGAQQFSGSESDPRARRWPSTDCHPVPENYRPDAWSRERPKTEEPGRGRYPLRCEERRDRAYLAPIVSCRSRGGERPTGHLIARLSGSSQAGKWG